MFQSFVGKHVPPVQNFKLVSGANAAVASGGSIVFLNLLPFVDGVNTYISEVTFASLTDYAGFGDMIRLQPCNTDYVTCSGSFSISAENTGGLCAYAYRYEAPVAASLPDHADISNLNNGTWTLIPLPAHTVQDGAISTISGEFAMPISPNAGYSGNAVYFGVCLIGLKMASAKVCGGISLRQVQSDLNFFQPLK